MSGASRFGRALVRVLAYGMILLGALGLVVGAISMADPNGANNSTDPELDEPPKTRLDYIRMTAAYAVVVIVGFVIVWKVKAK